MPSDDELMAGAREGDTVAFDAIVRRHQHRVQRFATRMAQGDATRGADVAVGAFVRLWEGRQGYLPEGKLQSWLLRTAYRLLVDEARRERPHEALDEFVDAEEGAQRLLERTACAEAVRDAIAELPQGQRAVVVLSVYEGLTHDAIAEILAIPSGTVASRKALALKTLRRRLAAWDVTR